MYQSAIATMAPRNKPPPMLLHARWFSLHVCTLAGLGWAQLGSVPRGRSGPVFSGCPPWTVGSPGLVVVMVIADTPNPLGLGSVSHVQCQGHGQQHGMGESALPLGRRAATWRRVSRWGQECRPQH